MLPGLKFGSTWGVDHTAGILFSHGMEIMFMDPLISAVQAKRQGTYQDIVGMLLALERETTQEKHLLQLLSCGLHSPDIQTREGVAIFLDMLAVCCSQLIILATVKSHPVRKWKPCKMTAIWLIIDWKPFCSRLAVK